jgi:hypothetical protein
MLVAPHAVIAQDAKPSEGKIDPAAVEIIRKSAQFLAKSPQLSFDWFSSYDEMIDGKKLTFMRSGSNLIVRDQGFYSRVEDDGRVREYFYDGKQLTVAAPEENFFATEDYAKGFESLVDAIREATDQEIPLYVLMVRDLPERIEDGLTSATYLGVTSIAGLEVYHLAFSDAEEDWQIWVSTDEAEPLPVVIVGTEPNKTGWPQYRAYLSDWKLEGDVDRSLFTFKPESDDVKISFPELKSRAEPDASPDGTSGPAQPSSPSTSDGAAAAPEAPAETQK